MSRSAGPNLRLSAALDGAPAPRPNQQLVNQQLANPGVGDPAATAAALAHLDLRDIQLPAVPAPWPPAPGWWLLGLLLLGALLRLGPRAWAHWRRWRRRRLVLAELERISALQPAERLVVGVAALLKRVALGRYGATRVAALTGGDWLAFLDRTGGDGLFQDGPGRVLAEGPYAPVATGLDRPALVAAARRWLGQNL